MCGLAGFFFDQNIKNYEDLQNRLHTGAKLLRHRGPNQVGVDIGTRHGLVNTRLYIQDGSMAADLPFHFPERKIKIAYNGEVSNFKELSRQYALREKYNFKSESDTEVVCYLYAEFGIGFLQHLTGMFSLAVVDEGLGKAYLVRDFFGITPLFFRTLPGELQFASELKVLREWNSGNLNVNRQGIFDFLTLGYIPGVATPYLEFQELNKGHYLEYDLENGKTHIHQYYRLNYSENLARTEQAAAEEIHFLLKDSVRRNLISAEPVGMTLSGGIDASSIVALAHQLEPHQSFHTFAIKVDEPSFDESRFQKIMSQRTGSIHHEILFSAQDVAEHFEKHVAFLDEPSANGAALPTFLMSKVASQHVKVLLSGEGGDEIFNAYDTHLASVLRRIYLRVPRCVRREVRRYLGKMATDYSKLSFDFKAKRFTQGAELSPAAAHIFFRHGFQEEVIRSLMVDSRGLHSTYDLFEELFEARPFPHELNRISSLDLDQYLYGDLMVKNDRMVMAHSVESRFPMLDRFLIEYMAQTPPRLRLNFFRPRYIQKRAMHCVLPREILRRKSFGLELPHSKWLLGPLRFLVDEYLSEKAVRESGIFDHQMVSRLWKEHSKGVVDHGRGLWSLIMYQAWHKMFFSSQNYRTHLVK